MPTGQGFLGHFALAISADGNREPLGVAAVSTLFRDGPVRKANETRRHAADRESLRWRDLVLEVEERTKHPALIHVMDRESDSYELLHVLEQQKNATSFDWPKIGTRRFQARKIGFQLLNRSVQLQRYLNAKSDYFAEPPCGVKDCVVDTPHEKVDPRAYRSALSDSLSTARERGLRGSQRGGIAYTWGLHLISLRPEELWVVLLNCA